MDTERMVALNGQLQNFLNVAKKFRVDIKVRG
jgi:hypothetical protein